MAAHNGAFLCLNCLSWGSNPNKTHDEEIKAVSEAFKAAVAAGIRPGAIVLQDYEFAAADMVDAVNQASGCTTWKAVRQYGEDGDHANRDTLVLYDKAVYIGTDIDKNAIGNFRDTEDILAGMQSSIKDQVSNFAARWSGVELEVVDPSTGVSAGQMFLLVSYHGRKMIKANNDIVPAQTAVKIATSTDFIHQVADCGAKESAPALIAGCWNVDSAPFQNGLTSNGLSKAPWRSTVHVSSTVEKDSVGQPKNAVDYAVAIHPTEGSNITTDLKVTEVVTLAHPADLASHFQHKPILVKVEVGPKA